MKLVSRRKKIFLKFQLFLSLSRFTRYFTPVGGVYHSILCEFSAAILGETGSEKCSEAFRSSITTVFEVFNQHFLIESSHIFNNKKNHHRTIKKLHRKNEQFCNFLCNLQEKKTFHRHFVFTVFFGSL